MFKKEPLNTYKIVMFFRKSVNAVTSSVKLSENLFGIGGVNVQRISNKKP